MLPNRQRSFFKRDQSLMDRQRPLPRAPQQAQPPGSRAAEGSQVRGHIHSHLKARQGHLQSRQNPPWHHLGNLRQHQLALVQRVAPQSLPRRPHRLPLSHTQMTDLQLGRRRMLPVLRIGVREQMRTWLSTRRASESGTLRGGQGCPPPDRSMEGTEAVALMTEQRDNLRGKTLGLLGHMT